MQVQRTESSGVTPQRRGGEGESSGRLDLQFAEFIEAVWACEHAWTLEGRIDLAIKCGR